MRKFLLVNLFVCIYFIGFSQSPVGIWKNFDDEDGKAKSHIEIYEKDGMLEGKVIKLLENATLRTCKKCKGNRKNAPIEGMVIMWDLQKVEDGYENGKIIDPKKGKEYGCEIKLASADVLEVRGYLKFSMFGRTQEWYRVTE